MFRSLSSVSIAVSRRECVRAHCASTSIACSVHATRQLPRTISFSGAFFAYAYDASKRGQIPQDGVVNAQPLVICRFFAHGSGDSTSSKHQSTTGRDGVRCSHPRGPLGYHSSVQAGTACTLPACKQPGTAVPWEFGECGQCLGCQGTEGGTTSGIS